MLEKKKIREGTLGMRETIWTAIKLFVKTIKDQVTDIARLAFSLLSRYVYMKFVVY